MNIQSSYSKADSHAHRLVVKTLGSITVHKKNLDLDHICILKNLLKNIKTVLTN